MGRRKLTNEEFQERLRQLREQGHDVYSNDEYVDSYTKIWFYCSKGHKWETLPHFIFRGSRCPYCAGQKVWVGFNDLYTTNPDIAILLKDFNDGYKYSSGSDKRVEFVCPVCKTVHKKIISNVCKYGFVCNACSDKVSYPQKFARALLKQLPVTNIHFEYNPDWIKPYRFDCYFKYHGVEYILEMDGGIGHGNYQFGNKKEKDIEGKRRDLIKNFSALKHGITVIRIDCYYKIDNRFEYIKTNILNSMLSDLFNLNNINWVECDKYGQTKMIPEVARLYNQGLSIPEIQNIIGYHRKTIGRWLKQANNIGLCCYDLHESLIRSARNNTSHNISVNRYTKDGKYIDTFVSMADAERQTGVSVSSICVACGKLDRSAGGYRWYKASDSNQPDKTKIVNLIIQD